MPKERGVALLMVLWTMVIMTVLTFTFIREVRSDLLLARNYLERTQAAALAEAGIWRGVMMLLESRQMGIQGVDLRLDGSPYVLDAPRGMLVVALQAEDGLVDLNSAPPGLLRGLIASLLPADEDPGPVVDAILDWRDRDSMTRPHGAEDEEYQAMGRDYGARDAPFISIEELRMIPGISQELYERLKPLVTIFSGEGRVTLENAPRKVLLALPGMTPELVEGIMALRFGGGAAIPSGLPETLREHARVTRSPYVRIRSKAVVGTARAGITAIVKVQIGSRDPVAIVSWRRSLDRDPKPEGSL